MTSPEIDNPFWQFSLRVYSAPDVSAECLELQERLGLDVNVVLFAAWLGAAQGVILQAADLERVNEAVATWAADVVRPLRTVRQKLKLMPELAYGDVQALRKRVAGAELFAEQIEQALLHQLALSLRRSQQTPSEAAARANVAAILGTRGEDLDGFPLTKTLAAVALEVRAPE